MRTPKLPILIACSPASKLRSQPYHRGDVNKVDHSESGAPIGIEGIMKSLPHRYPFLLIDRVLEIEPMKRVIALKNVTINEPFFQGHYPDYPIMPGVLIIECMAQAAGLLLMDEAADRPARAILFMAVDKARLRKPVVPGDQIELEAEMIRFRSGVAKVRAVARVDDQVVAEAELMAKVMDP